ncbi:hypothetical protein Agub_g6052 [Astrephomene gubernaculifera]|uniref:Methionyl-tRNA formyltransferase, mitochondrial n=1 Tax=Astrephomene gubernaculifera TaxID=47775 RepID=A0AAD3DMR5_9CHLO|nr:hypothetical protein Agub_g6052 [Astrephomene gubernaculifera]
MPPIAHGYRARPFTHSTRPVSLLPTLRLIKTSCTTPAVSAISTANGATKKHRVVFLGTPEVAADVLRELLAASQQPDSLFEVCLVVSQPGKPRGRGHRSSAPPPSPVEAVARDSGLLGPEGVVCPQRAKEESFLRLIEELQPDLAITAAYGNMLPQRFLDAPRYGTLNIHPSLLPRYRGAAPVQRALQDGVSETGVSVAYTVLACDAGPVLAQQRVPVDPDVQAPELLSHLFQQGTRLLLRELPEVLAGRGRQRAVEQDESQVLHANKLTREEAVLPLLSLPAAQLHNRVRAFAGWPGSVARLALWDEASDALEPLDLKIVRTRAPSASSPASPPSSPSTTSSQAPGHDGICTTPQQQQQQQQQPPQQNSEEEQQNGEDEYEDQYEDVAFSGDAMLLPCAGGTVLEVLQVQPPTKKVMSAKDFRNGLRWKRLLAPLFDEGEASCDEDGAL